MILTLVPRITGTQFEKDVFAGLLGLIHGLIPKLRSNGSPLIILSERLIKILLSVNQVRSFFRMQVKTAEKMRKETLYPCYLIPILGMLCNAEGTTIFCVHQVTRKKV